MSNVVASRQLGRGLSSVRTTISAALTVRGRSYRADPPTPPARRRLPIPPMQHRRPRHPHRLLRSRCSTSRARPRSRTQRLTCRRPLVRHLRFCRSACRLRSHSYGSEGWGFESLRARSIYPQRYMIAPPLWPVMGLARRHLVGICLRPIPRTPAMRFAASLPRNGTTFSGASSTLRAGLYGSSRRFTAVFRADRNAAWTDGWNSGSAACRACRS